MLFPEDGAAFTTEAIGFNTAYQHRLGTVVAARDTGDVVETVRFARQHGLKIAVQNTGHGVHKPITADILLSTRRLAGLQLDPESQTVTVGAGATWGSVFAAVQPYGLTPVAGSAASVGVVGYLLGGGLGPLARSHGFGSDYLEGLTLVSGQGDLLQASARENPDLFWALRGGKYGLGVVLEVKLRLVRLPELCAGVVAFPPATPPQAAFERWLEWTATAPELASTSLVHARTPGGPISALRYAYPGPAEEVPPLVGLGQAEKADPILLSTFHGDPTEPGPYWVSGLMLGRLDADFAAALGQLLDRTEALVAFELRHLGSATARDVPEGSCVGGRSAHYAASLIWRPQPELFERAYPQMEAQWRQALGPWLAAEGNINFAGRVRDQEHLDSCWTGEMRSRLAEVRQRYDPEGVFRS